MTRMANNMDTDETATSVCKIICLGLQGQKGKTGDPIIFDSVCSLCWGSIVYNRAIVYIQQTFLKANVHVIIIDQ